MRVFRFQSAVVIGASLLILALGLLACLLMLGESRVVERLANDKIAELELAQDRWRNELQATLARGEASIARYANLVSSLEPDDRLNPDSQAAWLARFERLVGQDADGAWRSRKSLFDPDHDAGIWIPPTATFTDADRRFYVRCAESMATFGAGSRDSFFGNLWLLHKGHGEVEFDPSTPNFIYDAGTDFPYLDSPWMALTEPTANASGAPQWTPASYDPILNAWLVSVVAPWRQGGVWSGSVGHDLAITTLFAHHERALPIKEQDLLVFDSEGLLIASTIHDQQIRAKEGKLTIKDLTDLRSLSALASVAATAGRGEGPLSSHAQLDDQGDLVLSSAITGPGWTTVTLAPRRQLTDAVTEQFAYLRWSLFGALAVIGMIGLGLLGTDLRRRSREQQQSQRVAESALIARRMAEEANLLKSRFLANMSHEIRTPMTGILGMSELLTESRLEAEQREMVEAIRTSGLNLLAIINDVLDLSKIEANHLELNSDPVDLDHLINEVIGLCAVEAARKNIGLTRATAPDAHVHRRGDPVRLRQILFNVVGNAVKFTDQGWVEVLLSDLGGGIRLQVKDTGMGIAPEDVKRIFQPFMQADASDTRRHGGTGLGLTITKGLVDLMEGEIHLHSELTRGTTVTIDLPLPKM